MHGLNAPSEGTGEGVVEQEVLDDVHGVELVAAVGLEGMPSGAGAQQRCPAQRTRHRIGRHVEGNGGAGVDEACGLVGAFETETQAQEMPALITRRGGGGDALELIGGDEHPFIERGALALMQRGGFGRLQEEAQAVDALPQLIGDLIAHGAGVFTRGADAVEDGVGIVGAECEEVGHQFTFDGGVGFVVALLVSRGHQNRTPELRFVCGFLTSVQQEILGGEQQAGEVFGALHVARHPINAVGDAA